MMLVLFNLLDQSRLAASAVIFSLISLILLESCGPHPAFAVDVEIRYGNPGPSERGPLGN